MNWRSSFSFFVLAVAGTGCGQTDVTENCGDYLCPADKICGSNHGAKTGCFDPERLADECADEPNWIDGAPQVSCAFGADAIAGVCRGRICANQVECGDGITGAGEFCDDGKHCEDGETCNSDADCDSGSCETRDGDGCSADCKSKETCGNDRLDAGEVCEISGPDKDPNCRADCQSDGTCGNGKQDSQTGEACDDGNNIDGDGCSANCKSTEYCGNGTLDKSRGEVCESEDPNCRTDCLSDGVCGNGLLDAHMGEVCDDGNNTDGDSCSANCKSAEYCGNGVIDEIRGEVCEITGPDATEGCRSDCRSNGICGNGELDEHQGEECDDGNLIAGDGCNSDCEVEGCGNGKLDVGEECEPLPGEQFTNSTGDACSSSCELIPSRWLQWTPPRENEPASMVYLDVATENGQNQDGAYLLSGAHPLHDHGLLWRWTTDRGWVRPKVGNGPPADSRIAVFKNAAGENQILALPPVSTSTWVLDLEAGRWEEFPNALPADTTNDIPVPVQDQNTGEAILLGHTESKPGNGRLYRWIPESEDDPDSPRWEAILMDLTTAKPSGWQNYMIAHDWAPDALTPRDRIIVFGGNTDGGPSAQLWSAERGATEDDPWTWTRLANAPQGRIGGAAVVKGDSLLVLGSSWLVTEDPHQQMLKFDLAAPDAGEWIDCGVTFFDGDSENGENTPGEILGTRSFLGAALLPVSAEYPDPTILLAGNDEGDGSTFALTGDCTDTEGYTGGALTPQSDWLIPHPSRTAITAIAYDPVRQEHVHYNGDHETWTFDGVAWEKKSPSAQPSITSIYGRKFSMMATHPGAEGGVVLYGGHDNGRLYSDLWHWDGETWSQLIPDAAPGQASNVAVANPAEVAARYYPGLASRPGGSVYLSGGSARAARNDKTHTRSEVFKWTPCDGESCEQQPFELVPRALRKRTPTVLLYNPDVDLILQDGGRNGNSSTANLFYLDESLEEGNPMVTIPRTSDSFNHPARHDHAMAYDPVRKVHVRYAGEDVDRGTYEMQLVCMERQETAESTPETPLYEDVGEVAYSNCQSSGDPLHMWQARWSRLRIAAPPIRRRTQMAHLPRYGVVLAPSVSRQFSPYIADTWFYTIRDGSIIENCSIVDERDEDGDGLVNCEDPDCEGIICDGDNNVCGAGACGAP